MSGSFENLLYDQGAYKADLRQSTAPLKYHLDPTFANSNSACFPKDIGYIGRQGVSINNKKSLIDVESDLFLLNYRNSRDPNQKYKPNCSTCGRDFPGYPCGGGVVNCPDCLQPDAFHFKDCSIRTDYSRATNPACNLRGTGTNRFQPLCIDPQDKSRWEFPGEIGINYRMVVLDNHVPCPPTLIDQTAAFPPNFF